MYEVIGIYSGYPILLNKHLNRLFESANKIHLEILECIHVIEDRLLKLIKANEMSDGLIYLQYSRGISPRDHLYLNKDITPNFVAYTKDFYLPTEYYEKGVSIIISKDNRWLRCDIKSLNLLPNILSKNLSAERGAYEAIFHRDNIITEGSSTNIFIIKNKVVYTHLPNNFILNGITRQKVIELSQELQIQVIEEPFKINSLFNADEIFITGTKMDIVPVTKIEHNKIGNNKCGTLTKNSTCLLLIYRK